MNLTDLVADVEHRLSYHPNVTADVAAAHESIRTILTNATKEALSVCDSISPAAREVSLALTAIEEADHWLHAHIARNQAAAVAAPNGDLVQPPPGTPGRTAPALIDPATGGPPVVPGASASTATPLVTAPPLVTSPVIEVPATGLVVSGTTTTATPPSAYPVGTVINTTVVDGSGAAPVATTVVDGSGIASVTNPAPVVDAPPTAPPPPPA